ncbi:hypothetical protein CDN99_11525 [Roseateles aquatilis]|uniref:Uncharacterized protein n=1 Tax=Roseateles aquatilis TaxID=431061 RepID=A0A246JDR3_9BURK|nr:DUF6502 family protein [Roseateles aquatilis]OWQ90792.1 hypothetical protein CDN99_11525 [Roseateles aquatilis]
MNANTQEQSLHIATLLLRPLIRLLVREGVGIAELVELSKRVYIEQASRQLEEEGRRVTDAALSTLTGVHRKDVKRIGTEAPLALTERRRKSLLDAVMSLWSGDARFIDERGAPRPLARRSTARESEHATFEDLIEEVSKGVPPKALLDAWLQQGAVRVDDDGLVRWAAPERAAGEELQSLTRSARIAADRMLAAWDKLHRPDAGHFLFSVRGEGLQDEDIERMHGLVRRWGRRFSDRLNREVTLAQARGRKIGGGQRYSFGLQSYAEASQPGEPLLEDRTAKRVAIAAPT